MPTDPASAPVPDAPSTTAESDESTAVEQVAPETPADPVAEALREWQGALAGIGGPNSLLWYDEDQLSLDLTDAHPNGIAMLLSHRPTTLTDMVREKTAFADALVRAQHLRDKADELRQEQGLSSMYLACGMVRLRLGQRTLAAPLLLRTADLRPTDPLGRDLEIVIGDGMEVNPALIDLLRRLDVTIDADAIVAKARTRSGFDPSHGIRELLAQTADVNGLTADRRMLVTTFTYAKADAAADLADNARDWARHPLIRVAAGVAPGEAPELPERDADGDLTRERAVIDLDATQTRVVEAVRAGTSVLLDAPATTGGTQVIAAALGAVVGDGGTGMLVASSRQALTDLVQRLASVGLGDLIVHADDDPRTRHRVIEQVLDSIDADVPEALEPDPRRVITLRTRLADHRAALHDKREPWGVTAAEAQSAIARLSEREKPPTSRVRLDADTLARTTRARATALGRVLAQAADRGAWRGGSAEDPWYGARLTSPEEAKAAGLVLRRLLGKDGIDRAEESVRAMCAEAHLAPSDSVTGWRDDIDRVTAVHATTSVFSGDVYDAPLVEMLAATSGAYRAAYGPQIGLWRRWSRRRQVKALLLPGVTPGDLHAELAAAHDQAQLWRSRSGPAARPHQAASLDAARAAVEGVRADIAWLATRLQGTTTGDGIEGLPAARLREDLTRLADRLDRAAVVPQVISVIDGARAAGFGSLVDDLARRDVPGDQVVAEVELVWWSSVLDTVRVADPRYGEHDAESLRRTRTQYAEADAALVAATAAHVRAVVARRARDTASRFPRQVAALRAELDRPEMPRRLADVWTLAPDVITAARPLWAVSPGALATVVPPSARFTVVAVDSAQSLVPAAAAGALARAKAALVVGDAGGIPPMPYRTAPGAATIDDDIDLVRGGRSLLDAVRGGLAPAALRVAHGRPDPRLDAVTGTRGLIHPPTPGGPTPVVVERVAPPRHTDLVSPDDEVQRVARLVLAHARGARTRSLGVVTVSGQHAARISAAIRAEVERLGPDSAEARGLGDLPEPLFVVPVHRLAGRTRDIVLFAPGFGIGSEGASAHRFGIISLPGGERLIAAAASSARRTLALVTSLTPGELGLARVPIDGVARLRALLVDVESAQDAAASTSTDDGPALSDPIVAGLAKRLRDARLTVRTNVGDEGRRIDIAASKSSGSGGRPVAVLVDDESLSALHGVRERERLWPAALESRGWTPMAVSLIDLFAAPAPEATRIVEVANAG